ncbi:S-adenosylmethionine decarboxylase family protein [Peribacillus tepidiphilus]|uniref:S-adenosylmethionine decarboxylase family protein n=1 Tax=Peribacillus tepidiphilus TaxID=2652445 RepID=UPI0035B509B1
MLEELLTKTVADLEMEILSTHFHSFTPQGVTRTIGISTSHFSIHTWQEHGYAALDLLYMWESGFMACIKKYPCKNESNTCKCL